MFRTSASILAVFGALCSAILFVSAPYAMRFMLGTAEGSAFAEGVSYLRAISAFYLFCFLGNAFAGFFDGIGKTSIPFIGAASHITLRAILSFLWIGTYGLTAVAYASGIGWILANAFWLIASVLVLRRGAGLRPQRADARHAL